MSFLSSVVLTYKGKILLLSPDIPSVNPTKFLWGFISGQKTASESSIQTIHRKVKQATKLDLKNIKLVSVESSESECIYHGELSDIDVNSIERKEGLRLEFYTLRELQKLNLTEDTEGFLNDHKETVEELLYKS